VSACRIERRAAPLQNPASSPMANLLTTEALVTEIPEKEKAPPMPPGGMDYCSTAETTINKQPSLERARLFCFCFSW
jgi:hypothetical protein